MVDEEQEEVRNKILGSLEFLAIKNHTTVFHHGLKCVYISLPKIYPLSGYFPETKVDIN